MPADEKLLSLFAPQTQIIRRHKAGKETEFERKLWLGEVEGGIISEDRLLDNGGGLEHPEMPASLEAHQQRFGRPPNLLAGDRGRVLRGERAVSARIEDQAGWPAESRARVPSAAGV